MPKRPKEPPDAPAPVDSPDEPQCRRVKAKTGRRGDAGKPADDSDCKTEVDLEEAAVVQEDVDKVAHVIHVTAARSACVWC